MSDVPKQLNPDCLKDTIVEIRFNTNLPEELVIGEIHHILSNDGYQYVSNPDLQQFQNSNKVGLSLRNFDPVFFNDIISIRPRPNSFILNTKNNYPLWSKYYEEIKKFIELVFKSEIFNGISRIGLRYINTFDGIDIFDKVSTNLELNIDGSDKSNTNLKTELSDGNYRVILNIGNGIKLVPDNKIVSVVDIDVISEVGKNASIDDILEIVNRAHEIEKKLFFLKVVKFEFWKEFNPSY
jgi:uncharacterized protein (TIGR04255 family)